MDVAVRALSPDEERPSTELRSDLPEPSDLGIASDTVEDDRTTAPELGDREVPHDRPPDGAATISGHLTERALHLIERGEAAHDPVPAEHRRRQRGARGVSERGLARPRSAREQH